MNQVAENTVAKPVQTTLGAAEFKAARDAVDKLVLKGHSLDGIRAFLQLKVRNNSGNGKLLAQHALKYFSNAF